MQHPQQLIEQNNLKQACTTYSPQEFFSCRKCCKSLTSDNELSFHNIFCPTTKLTFATHGEFMLINLAIELSEA